jgi:hypothetical protein
MARFSNADCSQVWIRPVRPPLKERQWWLTLQLMMQLKLCRSCTLRTSLDNTLTLIFIKAESLECSRMLNRAKLHKCYRKCRWRPRASKVTEEGTKRAVEDTWITEADRGNNLEGKEGSVAKVGGIRIRSKIFNTNRAGKQEGEATVGCSRPHSSKTLTRTRGCPTCLRTRTRCRSSRIARAVQGTKNSKPTNLISIPTKREHKSLRATSNPLSALVDSQCLVVGSSKQPCQANLLWCLLCLFPANRWPCPSCSRWSSLNSRPLLKDSSRSSRRRLSYNKEMKQPRSNI